MKSTRAFRTTATDSTTTLARRMGFHGAVATHHHLSALAAYDVLNDGGNAVDAGVAAVLVEGVVNPHMHGPAGECPILIAGPGLKPTVINGNTMAPRLATVDAYRQRGLDSMPDKGVLAAGVPASLSALITALAEFGTRPFHDVAAAATRLARSGFAMHAGLRHCERVGVSEMAKTFATQWPASAELYLRDGHPLALGERLCNPRLADVYDELSARSKDVATLKQSCDAVWRAFYQGSVADSIARFVKDRDGLLTVDDMAAMTTPVEQPLSVTFGNTEIFKCGFWCQGPALLQTLQILKQFDLASMAHNSADYLHHFAEATNLAYADREQFYADPTKVDVPSAALLSDDYARQRATLIDPRVANIELRPGDAYRGAPLLASDERVGGASWGPGTVHVDVGDANGMLASFTPSGGWTGSNEVIAELGFPLGNRCMTFHLDPPNHPNLIAPHKRPRTTISPTLVTRDGQPWLAYGTMGGDQQDQWMLQFYLNMVIFDMTVQEAIEAPKCSSEHFNGFFSPHDRFPKRLRVESAVGDAVIDALRGRGHDVDRAPMWSEGYLNAVCRHPHNGCLEAGADPRGAKGDVFPQTALAW